MSLNHNREQRRAQQRHINRVSKAFGDALVEIPASQWTEKASPGLVRVLRSKHVLVQEYAPAAGTGDMVVCRLSILLIDLDGDRWTDGIGWDQLFKIKNDCGYSAFDAVEVHPRLCDLVDVAAIRHLWVLRGLLPFAWR